MEETIISNNKRSELCITRKIAMSDNTYKIVGRKYGKQVIRSYDVPEVEIAEY